MCTGSVRFDNGIARLVYAVDQAVGCVVRQRALFDDTDQFAVVPMPAGAVTGYGEIARGVFDPVCNELTSRGVVADPVAR
jgi:hypothetical protein